MSDLDGYLVAHALMRDCDYCPHCGRALNNDQCRDHGHIADDVPEVSTADRRDGRFLPFPYVPGASGDRR